MRVVLESVAGLALDLALAGLAARLGVCGPWRAIERSRPGRLRRIAATRAALAPLLPWSLTLGVVACLALFALGGSGDDNASAIPVGLAVPAGALGSAGVWLLLLAGARERAGRSADARRLARAGGMWIAIGALAGIALALAHGFVVGSAASSPLFAVTLLALAGSCGLVGGLAAKPSQAGILAALAFVVARVWLVAAGTWPPPLGAG